MTNLNSAHDWLYGACRCGDPVTVGELAAELAQVRQGPTPETWDDLPRSEAEWWETLKQLELAGRAIKCVFDGNVAWRWAAGKQTAAAAVEHQKGLF